MEPGRGRTIQQALAAATVVLMVAAVGVRGIRGEVPRLPGERERVPDAIAEPVQLLGAGARRRLGELTDRLPAAQREAWLAVGRVPFRLTGCPELQEWLVTADGQRVMQLAGDLRKGAPVEALASLALIFEIARATEWAPGVLGSDNAERLGALLDRWLQVWAAPAAGDPQLAEPAVAAAVFYARVMRLAYDAPALTRASEPYDRAKQFLERLTGANETRLTGFGEVLSAQYSQAFDTFRRETDFLRGFDREAELLFPDLDGECER